MRCQCYGKHLRCWGGKTRLESSIKKLNLHFIHDWSARNLFMLHIAALERRVLTTSSQLRYARKASAAAVNFSRSTATPAASAPAPKQSSRPNKSSTAIRYWVVHHLRSAVSRLPLHHFFLLCSHVLPEACTSLHCFSLTS